MTSQVMSSTEVTHGYAGREWDRFLAWIIDLRKQNLTAEVNLAEIGYA